MCYAREKLLYDRFSIPFPIYKKKKSKKKIISLPTLFSFFSDMLPEPHLFVYLVVGNPIGKNTLIFIFDGKIEYIILPMLILFLDTWQNMYGWMPSL